MGQLEEATKHYYNGNNNNNYNDNEGTKVQI